MQDYISGIQQIGIGVKDATTMPAPLCYAVLG
jgi:hypothetical protein